MKRRLIGGILLAAAFAACRGSEINEYPVPRPLLGGADDEADLKRALEDYERAVAAHDLRGLFFVQGRLRLLAEKTGGTDAGDTALFYIGKIYYDAGDDYDARLAFLKHRRAYPDSPWRETIAELTAEMDARAVRYRNWLEESRTGSTRSRESP